MSWELTLKRPRVEEPIAILQVYCFRGMCGMYTSGLQIAIATCKEEAIELIVEQFRKDNEAEEAGGRRMFHSGTWRHDDCFGVLDIQGKSEEEILRLQLTSLEPMIFPVAQGVVIYCGGGD